jgi:hypothetical protein
MNDKDLKFITSLAKMFERMESENIGHGQRAMLLEPASVRRIATRLNEIIAGEGAKE